MLTNPNLIVFCLRLGSRIMNTLGYMDINTHSDYTTKSRSYRQAMVADNFEAAVQGNVIFDPTNQLPREVLLEMSLKAFGYSMNIWEVCMS